MSNLESDALIKALNRAQSKKPSAEDVVDTLIGRQKKSSNIIAKPVKKRTSKKRAKQKSKDSPIDGNEILKQIKADRSKTAKNSGAITSNGKVLASSKGSEASEADSLTKEKSLTQQEQFLNQIEQYNDFIIQNDLDTDKIDVINDYDFSAFETPEDWAIESERLADRLSDRKIEIKQNEYAGEFAGMELENGVPSYEAVQNMDDEQFAEYEAKYLTPFNAKAQVKEAVQTVPVVYANQTDENATIQKFEPPITPNDDNVKVDFSDDIAELSSSSNESKEQEYEFSLPAAWELLKGTHSGIKNAIDSVDSVGKVIEQGQPINALQDAGRGVMHGLADTAGDIADLGGLVPNAVADIAHESADWWEDQYEIVNSEAGNIGTNIGTEAVAGGAGGVIGKGVGKVYQGLKQGGEALRKRATTAAKDREAMALEKGMSPLESVITKQKAYENMTNVPPRHSYAKALIGDAQPIAGSMRIDPIPYGHSMTKEDYLTKAIREKNHLNGKDLDSGYTAYDVLNPVAGKMEYPTVTRILDTAIHNAKHKLDSRAMLKRNDTEIETMFNQGTPLDKALKIRQNRWDRLPAQGTQAGALIGLGIGTQQY